MAGIGGLRPGIRRDGSGQAGGSSGNAHRHGLRAPPEAIMSDLQERAGVDPPTTESPVFILAPPRSFSTVTTALMGGHRHLYALPEMLTFSSPTVGDLLAGVGCICRRPPEIHPPDCGVLRARLSGPYRAIAQLHEGSQKPDAIK